MEIVSSIATKTFEYAIFHQLGYLIRYKNNIKDFKKQANDLELAKSRVKALIVEAENQGETIHNHVLTHLTDVDKIVDDINDRNFSNVSCFNLFRRYRSSREAKKMRDELAMFQADLDKLDKVSYRGPLPWIDSVPGYLSFESRDLIVKKIVEALEEPDIYIIGVPSTGGTGKTMLVKQISCHVSDSKLFEPVIMAVVGQNPDINVENPTSERCRELTRLINSKGLSSHYQLVLRWMPTLLIWYQSPTSPNGHSVQNGIRPKNGEPKRGIILRGHVKDPTSER